CSIRVCSLQIATHHRRSLLPSTTLFRSKAEVAHVEVGVALVQNVPHLPHDDPVDLVGVLPHDGAQGPADGAQAGAWFLHRVLGLDRKSTRLNSSHDSISYAVFCLKKKK